MMLEIFSRLLHGLYHVVEAYTVDPVREERKLCAKSLGNSPEPLELIEQFGADGVRVGMLLCSPAGNDLIYDNSLPEQGRNFANKIWNAFRLVKSWSVDNTIAQPESASKAVLWMEEVIKKETIEIDHNFKKFRISEALMSVYKLFWDEFSAWYLEMVKPEYQKPIDQKTYVSTISFFEKLMKLIHPFMPFITEEIWQTLGERRDGESIMIERLPEAKKYNKELIAAFESIKETVGGIRNVRKERNIPMKEQLSLNMLPGTAADGREFYPVVIKLCNLSEILTVNEKPEGAASFMTGTTEYYIPLGSKLDIEAEIKKIRDELEYNRGFLASVLKKLGNERFVQNAPANVIELERKKKSDAETKIRALEERLKELGK
jgi:valyl-tRNA synthetase